MFAFHLTQIRYCFRTPCVLIVEKPLEAIQEIGESSFAGIFSDLTSNFKALKSKRSCLRGQNSGLKDTFIPTHFTLQSFKNLQNSHFYA